MILLNISCSSESDNASCDEISMRCYRGHPRSCHNLKKKCSGKKIKYTAALCQQAFNSLLLGGKLDKIVSQYGSEITGCFNERELKKYSH